MATYVNMDSLYRDRGSYPNENSYELFPGQVEMWFKQPRTTTSTAHNPATRPLSFGYAMRLTTLVVPYSDVVAGYPIVYVQFQANIYKDPRLIDAPDGNHSTAQFICNFHKIQNDSAGEPLWIHYTCSMKQFMRFVSGQPITFEISGRSGYPLPQQDTNESEPIDPNKQTIAVIEIVPYEIDGTYSDTRNSQPLVP